jgi:lipoprotein-anchoring transpeptidase ErfK/SrfK
LRKLARPRVLFLLVCALLVVGGGVAGAVAVTQDNRQLDQPLPPPESPTTTVPPTTAVPPPTTAPPPPTIQQPPLVALPPVPNGEIGSGASGPEVQAYEQRLADLRFDPGPIDGVYDQMTFYAVQALQKLRGAEPTGRINEADRFALNLFRYPAALQADGEPNRTEVDVTKQVLTLYENSQPALITPVSTGSGENYCYNSPRDNPTERICEDANTPSGRYTYYFFYDGWHKSPLGQLYNPFYFNKGIAVHGYQEVPAYPASHGCVRIPMLIAEYFHTLVHNDDPVYVFGGTDANITSVEPLGGGRPRSTPRDPVPPPGEPTPPPDTTPPRATSPPALPPPPTLPPD